MSRFAIADDARPPLWGQALSSAAFCSDVTGANLISPRERNGVAVSKPSGGNDCPGPNGETMNARDCASKIGLMTDRWGNQIWVTSEGGAKWELMQYYKLWGRGARTYTIPLPRFFGNDAAEQNALLLMEKRTNKPKICSDLYGGCHNAILNYESDYWTSNARATSYFGFVKKYGYSFEYDSAPGICRNIDLLCSRIKGRVDGPIVILLVGHPITLTDIGRAIIKAVTVICSTLAPFVGHFDIPELSFLNSPQFQGIVAKLSSVYDYFATGGTLDASNISSLIRPIAELVTPAAYKRQLAVASDVYTYYMRDDYGGVARALGLDAGVIRSLGGDIFTTLAQSETIAKSSKGDIAQIVQNLSNLKMLDGVARWAHDPSVILNAIVNQPNGKGFAAAVPQIRDWLLASAGGLAGQVAPNAANVVSAVLNVASDPALGSTAAMGTMSEGTIISAQLALSALGFPAAEGSFDALGYASLRSQAQAAKARAAELGAVLNGFMLPAAVPRGKRALWAGYLAEDEGIVVGSTIALGHAHYREWY